MKLSLVQQFTDSVVSFFRLTVALGFGSVFRFQVPVTVLTGFLGDSVWLKPHLRGKVSKSSRDHWRKKRMDFKKRHARVFLWTSDHKTSRLSVFFPLLFTINHNTTTGTHEFAAIWSCSSTSQAVVRRRYWIAFWRRWDYERIWVWINTYENTIFNGMNIHFIPAILMWTEGVLLVLTHCQWENLRLLSQTCICMHLHDGIISVSWAYHDCMIATWLYDLASPGWLHVLQGRKNTVHLWTQLTETVSWLCSKEFHGKRIAVIENEFGEAGRQNRLQDNSRHFKMAVVAVVLNIVRVPAFGFWIPGGWRLWRPPTSWFGLHGSLLHLSRECWGFSSYIS